ncbi:MAG TPA: efflux transporter outer membrane subunit [Candidatus Binatia bacterium]|nr:efflux transporter outer membrane subunit [Candidatus Binatia bacterium]
MRGRLAALAAIGLLFGCSPVREPRGVLGRLWRLEVGPDYRRPAVATPPDFRNRIGPAEAASFADLPWWRVFDDATLGRLIGEALADNFDLQAAVARVGEARARVGVAASPLYPQVGYQGEASRSRVFFPIGAGGNVTFDTFAGLFDVAWEIDVWGRIRRATEAARANLLASEEARRGVVLTLVSDVATAYFQLLELDRELEIAHESTDAYRETRDLFLERYRHGTDTKISIARAEAALDASLAATAAVERQIAQQEDAISVLLGADPEPIPRGLPLVAQAMPATPPGLTTALLHRRPDIRQAEEDMIAANALVGVAVASFFPTIGLSALYGGQGERIGDVVKDSFSIWNVAGNAAGPLFEGGRLLESYRAQRAFWDETIARYRATVVTAFREVSDALAAEATLTDQRAALEKQVAALREAKDLSLLRYHTGYAYYFEVLDAEQQLYPAEAALAQTQRDQLLAVVSLYRALGGGWETPGDPAAGP